MKLKLLLYFSSTAKNITKLSQDQPLSRLLPANTNHFYRYDGSLTTPKCNEVVTWTVFKNHVNISTDQVR